MKRTKLRRQSKNPRRKLIVKADRALQDWYRKQFPKDKCLICGERAELRHHFILKSQCNRLRYDKINLIPICKKCHSKVHGFQANIINSQIVFAKGRRWWEKINKRRQEHIDLSPKYLEEIIEKYQ